MNSTFCHKCTFSLRFYGPFDREIDSLNCMVIMALYASRTSKNISLSCKTLKQNATLLYPPNCRTAYYLLSVLKLNLPKLVLLYRHYTKACSIKDPEQIYKEKHFPLPFMATSHGPTISTTC